MEKFQSTGSHVCNKTRSLSLNVSTRTPFRRKQMGVLGVSVCVVTILRIAVCRGRSIIASELQNIMSK